MTMAPSLDHDVAAAATKTVLKTSTSVSSVVAATNGGNGSSSRTSSDNNVNNNDQLAQDLQLFLEHPSLKHALADGSLDLSVYSGQVEQELHQLEEQCMQMYRDKTAETQALAQDLSNVQTVLASLHEMLLGFDADLGGLSHEIRDLQQKSRVIDVQLKNRKAAETPLCTFLQHLVLSPALVEVVQNEKGPMNAQFAEAVHEVQAIYEYVHESKAQEWCNGGAIPCETQACRELQPQLTALRLQCVRRIRLYFLSQFALLQQSKKHHTNVRMIQKHGLLRFGSLMDFMSVASPPVAAELEQVYRSCMSKTLLHLFRLYHAQLSQLDATKRMTRADVLAVDDAHLKEVAAHQRSASKSPHHRAFVMDYFALGSRLRNVLEDVNDGGGGVVITRPPPPILAHVATAEGHKFPYERLWSSWLSHLAEAVTNEHVFGRQFFQKDLFVMFGPTVSFLLEQLENYLFGCYDALCLLLMIKVTHYFRRLLRRRKIASLDPFLDQATKLLWPRLKAIMEHHQRSLQQATPAKLLSSVVALPGGAAVHAASELHCHYVTRRMSEFACSLLLILHQPVVATVAASPAAPPAALSRKSPLSAAAGRSTGRTGGNKLPFPPTPQRSSSVAGSSLAAAAAAVTSKPPVVAQRANSHGSPTKSVAMANSPTTALSSASNAGSPPTIQRAASLGLESTSTHSNSVSAGDKLLQDLSHMLDEYELLLDRLSEQHKDRQKRVVFKINNLDHIVCVFQERKVLGKELNRFIERLMQEREAFVEDELLLQGFSTMIAFVQQTEAHFAAAGGSSASANVNAQVVEALVLDFASNWKTRMEQINRNVLSYFSNFRNGMEILKQCLTQLLLYYTRFQDILRKVYPITSAPPPFSRDLVSTTVILAEIKKYALSI